MGGVFIMIEVEFGEVVTVNDTYRLEVVGYNPITTTTALLDIRTVKLGHKRKSSRVGTLKRIEGNWHYLEFKYLGPKFLLKIFI